MPCLTVARRNEKKTFLAENGSGSPVFASGVFVFARPETRFGDNTFHVARPAK